MVRHSPSASRADGSSRTTLSDRPQRVARGMHSAARARRYLLDVVHADSAGLVREDELMRLILGRHGQTGSNISRALDTTEPGPDLTDLGPAQAAALPRVPDSARSAPVSWRCAPTPTPCRRTWTPSSPGGRA